jgi:hypothetical protein
MAHKNKLEVLEGLQPQGVNESVNWAVATTNWGGSPSGPDYDIFDEDDLATSLKPSLMPGTATVSGDDVILPTLSGLTARVIYRITVSFTSGGNDLECYFRVKGT